MGQATSNINRPIEHLPNTLPFTVVRTIFNSDRYFSFQPISR